MINLAVLDCAVANWRFGRITRRNAQSKGKSARALENIRNSLLARIRKGKKIGRADFGIM